MHRFAILAASVAASELEQNVLTQELFLSSVRPDEISGEKDTVYISNIDVNSVAPCKYATRAAFFDLSDIIHGGDK